MKQILMRYSVAEREACARCVGIVIGIVAGVLVLAYMVYPSYTQLGLFEVSMTVATFTLVFLALTVAVAGVVGLAVIEIATYLAATFLLSKDDRDGFMKFRSWTT